MFKFTGNGEAQQFDLQIVKAGTGNVVGSIPVTLNSSYFYLAQAIDPDKDTLTYSLPIAPAQATIDPPNRVGQLSAHESWNISLPSEG